MSASSRWRAGFRRTIRRAFDTFVRSNSSSVADDLDGDPVFLARNQFNLDYTRERAPGMAFADIKDVKKAGGGVGESCRWVGRTLSTLTGPASARLFSPLCHNRTAIGAAGIARSQGTGLRMSAVKLALQTWLRRFWPVIAVFLIAQTLIARHSRH